MPVNAQSNCSEHLGGFYAVLLAHGHHRLVQDDGSDACLQVNTVAEAELDGTKGLLGKLAKSVTARSKKSATSRAGGKMDDGMNGSSPGASVYSKQASSPLAPGVGTTEAEVRMQSFEAGKH